MTVIKWMGVLLALAAHATQAAWTLENDQISWQWRETNGALRLGAARDGINGVSLPLDGELFRIELGDGTVKSASDFKLEAPPVIEDLAVSLDSPTAANHFPGRQLVAKLSAPDAHLRAEFRAILRNGSSYVRQELRLQAVDTNVAVGEIVLFDEKVAGAKTIGTVDGSPVVAGTFFFGYEQPMARNVVDEQGGVRCSFVRNALLKNGETLTQSWVAGVTPRGQLRRGVLRYIERERAHPYRPFLHYNSWFDIAWDKQKFDESQSLNVISQVGNELVVKRGVELESFLFDDGWDDNRTLWKFHSGFPDGFTRLKQTAADLHAGIGVWLSPFGGYDVARTQRVEYGRLQGFETNASGFSLAGPKYYERFHDICMNMVQQYGVNEFKFDGLAAGASANGLARDGDAMLRLIGDLRHAEPNIYINQTTGTWPSPFWLLYVDSTWRGGADHDFAGEGPARERWITYRDWQTYKNVVQRGPLYPLNALMLHGVIFAVNAKDLTNAVDGEFAHEVHSFFGAGTQLQEMYITPRLLSQRNWDDLAEAAKWSRANSDVLVDTHWIGGDPGQGEVYGWASWSPRKGILVLRNPAAKSAVFDVDVKNAFELPEKAPRTYTMRPPWQADRNDPPVTLQAGQPHRFVLPPWQTLVLESK
ncbi:MAG TPA: enterotoxin [Verrucomicrobiae bacterium]|nr:enterotoxin [Verrucomicrobiae bacterium]